MRFEFHSGRIVFGPGSALQLPAHAKHFGSRPLVVTGRSPERFAQYLPQHATIFSFAGEPTLDTVRAGVSEARAAECDVVVGIGGGSALDAAKAIASLTPNSGEPLDYLEVIGKGLTMQRPGLPIIAVPSTAGTGAEVTRNAVLGAPEYGLKASLRGASLLPAIAIVDPALTFSLSAEITATTGLDTLTQLLEAFVSARATPLTDSLCRDGLSRVGVSLRAVYRDGYDAEARENMSYASMLSGLALANAGLGVVHGFAAPLGGLLQASHGSICAAVLAAGTAANLKALRERNPTSPAIPKYREAKRLLSGRESADDVELVEWLRQLTRDLGIRSLGHLGLVETQIPELVAKAAKANSMKANALELTTEEMEEIAVQSMSLS
jgi:alcohol dehydrogenase class IV